jgi:hypothetical protein
LYGVPKVYIHRVKKDQTLADALLDQEELGQCPAEYSSLPQHIKDQLRPIFEPGVHLGILIDSSDVVFMVRIGYFLHIRYPLPVADESIEAMGPVSSH